jgi:hypothetical protein
MIKVIADLHRRAGFSIEEKPLVLTIVEKLCEFFYVLRLWE